MDYGKLTDEDKVYIGNPYPALQLGLNMNFEYKGFDLAANFFGTFGNKIFNLQKARYSGAGGQNVFKGTLNKAWHGEGTSDDIPRLSYNDLNQNYTRVSDFFVEDGDYFRCKLLRFVPEPVHHNEVFGNGSGTSLLRRRCNHHRYRLQQLSHTPHLRDRP